MVTVFGSTGQLPAGQFRHEFAIPVQADGARQRYFCGNSLGLMPLAARREVLAELDRWGQLGVEGHFVGDTAWMPYHRLLTGGLAALTGALPIEVVAMNTLTVNLQLLMSSFYRPAGRRRTIVIEARAFPSDRHAVLGQLGLHGLDAADDLVEVTADPHTGLIDESALETVLEREADRVALVLWPGVQYATGQRFDLPRIVRAAHAAGAQVGLDLAHAIGNVPLDLHSSGADFAVWCSYKYLNSGPGALAGAFVHERHADFQGPRLSGWWGHDEKTRFLMGPEFRAARGADGWQLSNPSILAAAPLRASLGVFAQAGGIDVLRSQSIELTGHLHTRIAAELHQHLDVITPVDPERRGCQLSLRMRRGRQHGRALFESLHAAGCITDWREPDVIRVSPAPLYNNREDVDALVDRMLSLLH